MEVSLEREIRVPVGDPQALTLKIDKYLWIRLGDAAPDFTGTTLDGKSFKLSELKGKVVLLDFWATWCTPCLAEVPNIKKAVDRFGKDGRFVVVGISLDTSERSVKAMVERFGMNWPNLVLGPAEENPVAKRYGVSGIPAMFLIDADGKVVARDLRGEALQTELAKRLEPAATEQTAALE
ncbi:MAG: TlpA family protein disulfide reductase [Phycisphaerae bacterium]|nr:TlpA family protein disulfide reductase [Phycisphaerae bacterium]